MVKILPNGDIVQDDDPRVQKKNAKSGSSSGAHRPQFQHGFNSHQEPAQVSVFQMANQRLMGYGVPRWSVGNIVIEPLVLIGLLISLLLFGLPGLMFGLILFAVCSWSQNGTPDFISRLFGNNNEHQIGDNRSRGSTGVGYRLGR